MEISSLKPSLSPNSQANEKINFLIENNTSVPKTISQIL